MGHIPAIANMRRVLALVFMAVLQVSGCEHDSKQTIPNGVYREPSDAEMLIVKGPEIEFHIRVLNPRMAGIFERTYSYHLEHRNGVDELGFGGSSNDPVRVEGVGAYHWYWDGSNIIRKRFDFTRDGPNLVRHERETVIFAPEEKIK
jgi:hypothetical protein